jgi:hypothetical protein
MIALVKKLTRPPAVGSGFDDPPWQEVPTEQIRNHMGEKPVHFPRTEVKIAYVDAAIHVMFRVRDRYVRAIATKHQDSVCGDSCVEFFFTPGPDPSKGYFNVEMNCGGTILFHYHSGQGRVEVRRSDCDKVAKEHSLPAIIDPEIEEPVTWTVAYSIPLSVLAGYCPVSTPKPHTIWRGNFYKCADHTSHPHWLTWSPVDHPRPNFHLPQFFGVLEFE